jgi:hypothetical protein
VSATSSSVAYSGKGWLLIQPFEGRVVGAAPGGGGKSSGAGGVLGSVLGR